MNRRVCHYCKTPLLKHRADIVGIIRCGHCGRINRARSSKTASNGWPTLFPTLSTTKKEGVFPVPPSDQRGSSTHVSFKALIVNTDQDPDSRVATAIDWRPRGAPRVELRGEKCSTPKDSKIPESIPRSLGSYDILDEVGRGGMGIVLRARDRILKRDVAIKIMRPETSGDIDRRLRFVEEAQITGQLQHPGIAPVHFLGRDARGHEYFVMKLVSGVSLDEIIQKWHAQDLSTRRAYPHARLLSIFERIVETVGFAHARGVLHRDLKPSNIMIGKYGEVWVLDWGLAKVVNPETGKVSVHRRTRAVSWVRSEMEIPLTLDGHTVGTPEYMSPEQAQALDVDQGTDIFSLGAILYHLLTGHSPYQGPSKEAVLSEAALGCFRPMYATDRGRFISRELNAIVQKCMSRRSRDRYRGAQELLADLRAFAAGETLKALPDTWGEKIRRWARRNRRILALSSAATIVFLITFSIAAVLVARKNRDALRAYARAAETSRLASQDQERAKQMEVAMLVSLLKIQTEANTVPIPRSAIERLRALRGDTLVGCRAEILQLLHENRLKEAEEMIVRCEKIFPGEMPYWGAMKTSLLAMRARESKSTRP